MDKSPQTISQPQQLADWWQQQLNDVIPLDLPKKALLPANGQLKVSVHWLSVDEALKHRLNDYADSRNCVPSLILLYALIRLLHRYTEQSDIVLGYAETDSKAYWPLRYQLDPQNGMSQALPLLHKRYQRFCDFTKQFEVDTFPAPWNVTFARSTKKQASPAIMERVDLAFWVDISSTESDCAIGISFRPAHFDVVTIERMTGHWLQLLNEALDRPTAPQCELPMLTAAEQQQIFEQFNVRNDQPAQRQTVVDLFRQQLGRTPDLVAMTFEGQHMTYQDLEIRSNQLAHVLWKEGVRPSGKVGLCMERGLEMIIAILGIIKTGAAYVPLDMNYPPDRIRYMLADSEVSVVLGSVATQPILIEAFSGPLLLMDSLENRLSLQAETFDLYKVSPEDLVYVIYTSGSTGAPKGVLIEHGGLVNLCRCQIEVFGMFEGGGVLQFASLSFDASCSEIFTSLLVGGRLVIPKQSTLMSPKALGKLLEKENVKIATLPPSYQHYMEPYLGGLQTLISAGEALQLALGKRLQDKGIRLINGYGPTENTIGVSLADQPIHEDGQVSIGFPIPNVEVLILDSHRQLQPIGLCGEIYVGGVQLARAYQNKPELTRRSFVDHPFREGLRLYRTGDLGKWLPGGELVFLGRCDDQVKIRGYRVELGEIEEVLRHYPGVTDCVLLLVEEIEGIPQLAAYLSGPDPAAIQVDKLREYAQKRLAPYMMPDYWTILKDFPLSITGKVDKKQLPPPNRSSGTVSKEAQQKQSDLEKQVVVIWQTLLEIPAIGAEDDFFELGGHSLLAISCMAQIEEMTGQELDVDLLFEYPTLAAFCEQLQQDL